MPEKKKDKVTLQIIFSSILLTLIFLVEIYAMINAPGQFIVIGIVGVLFIACLYVLIQAIMMRIDMKKQEEIERYENLFKSEKATYLMLKKYFSEIEDKLNLIEKTSKVPTEEIVGTQKGIGKVLISRSRENAEAIMSSNEILIDRFDQFEDVMGENNDKIIASYKNVSDEHVNQLMMKQQDIIMSLKDMELRLNSAIMQSQKVVAAPQIVAAPVAAAMPAPAVVAAPEAVSIPESAPVMETAPVPEMEPVVEETIIEEKILEEETIEEEIAEEEISDDEINALLNDISSAVEELPVEEEKPPMPDLSDPNKMMSPDDIAALLANMGGDEAPAEDPAPEPEPAPAAPEIDLSDPNKQLSADEIAALFATMGS